MRCALFQRLLPAVLCLGVCVSLQVGCPRPSDSIDSKQGAPGNGQAEARGGDAPDRDEDNSTTAGNDRGGGSSARNAVVSDKPVEFDEPAGITYAGGMLYVADTNNHEIRTIDLDNGYRVSTFVIDGLEPPRVPPEPPANSDKREAEAGPSIVEEAPASDPPRSDPRTAEPRPPTPPETARRIRVCPNRRDSAIAASR